MEQNETIKKFLPPRVINSVSSGVNRIEKQPYLLIFPVLYDLLLWLGPNLSIKAPVVRLFSQFLTDAENIYGMANIDPQPLYDLQILLTEFLTGYNLLSIARTFPIGIPTLLSNVNTSTSPLGISQIIHLSSFGNIFLVILLLAIMGVLLGTFYFRLISPKPQEVSQSSIIKNFANSFVYSLLLLIIVAFGLVAATFISSFFAIFAPVLGQFVLASLIMAIFFLLLPSFYAFVPIFLYGQSFFQAVITSYKIVGLRLRYKIDHEQTIVISPRIITFTMAIIILYQGLNIVWLKLPPIDSWWMIAGILGHAFTSTLIITSSFDFFQKMCEWHHDLTQAKVC